MLAIHYRPPERHSDEPTDARNGLEVELTYTAEGRAVRRACFISYADGSTDLHSSKTVRDYVARTEAEALTGEDALSLQEEMFSESVFIGRRDVRPSHPFEADPASRTYRLQWDGLISVSMEEPAEANFKARLVSRIATVSVVYEPARAVEASYRSGKMIAEQPTRFARVRGI